MNKIKIFGDINKYSLDKNLIRDEINSSLLSFGISEGTVEVNVVSASKIGEINLTYRKIDKPTDVLSFPQIRISDNKTLLGELVISPEIIAKKNETVTDAIKHGLLHLLGYDHEQNQSHWNEGCKKINCNL